MTWQAVTVRCAFSVECSKRKYDISQDLAHAVAPTMRSQSMNGLVQFMGWDSQKQCIGVVCCCSLSVFLGAVYGG